MGPDQIKGPGLLILINYRGDGRKFVRRSNSERKFAKMSLFAVDIRDETVGVVLLLDHGHSLVGKLNSGIVCKDIALG